MEVQVLAKQQLEYKVYIPVIFTDLDMAEPTELVCMLHRTISLAGKDDAYWWEFNNEFCIRALDAGQPTMLQDDSPDFSLNIKRVVSAVLHAEMDESLGK